MEDELLSSQQGFAYDAQAGPVYRFSHLSEQDVYRLSRRRDCPHVIEVIVWPYPEGLDQRPELRRYFTLNLPQAVARAAEIEIRLREQSQTFALVAIRRSTIAETDVFFRAIDRIEAEMPGPVTETSLCPRTTTRPRPRVQSHDGG